MPTTIITEEQWQKLKPILLNLNIYDKPSLKETVILPYLMAGSVESQPISGGLPPLA